MRVRAALLWEQPGQWRVEDVEIPDEPGPGEVLVEMAASGLCHSDDHFATGDVPLHNVPYCGGHEGSGVVRAVGPGVHGLVEGDHVVTSFVAACGRCRWCASGNQNLCDYGAHVLGGAQVDGTYRMWTGDGRDVARMAMLGTFASWQVLDQLSVIKIRPDVPLGPACLVACGVPTGFGAAVSAAGVRPGDVVVVMGSGGIGINAVQGAALAGARHVIVVDPVAFKRQTALTLGATSAFAGIEEATEFARSVTNGQGADSAIVTVGIISARDVGHAFKAIRKAGTVAVAAMGSLTEASIPASLFELTMYQKRIQGVLYGTGSPRESVGHLLDLYADGKLRLDELVTTRYPLERVNDGYADMRAGRNIRGVIEFGH